MCIHVGALFVWRAIMETKYKSFCQKLAILRRRGMDIPDNSNKQRNIIKNIIITT